MWRPPHNFVPLALVALACIVQWQVCRRAVGAAQDTTRYTALAQNIDRLGMRIALASDTDQPLFPLAVATLHARLPAAIARIPTAWLRTAQLVASFSLAASLLPLHGIWRVWLGRRKATLAAFVFLALPEVARLGADGLSDSLGLFFLALAIYLICRSLLGPGTAAPGAARPAAPSDRQQNVLLLASGICLGLALLTNSEALIVVAALWIARLGLQKSIEPTKRASPGRYALLLSAGMVVVWLPYLAASGAATPRSVAARLLGVHRAASAALLNGAAASSPPAAAGTAWRLEDGTTFDFTRKDATSSSRRVGIRAALAEYGREWAKLLHYWVGLLALWGAWKMRRARRCLVGRLLFFLFAIYSTAVVVHAAQVGYLSTRHLLPLAPIAAGWASHAIVLLGKELVDSWNHVVCRVPAVRLRRPLGATGALAGIVVLAMLPVTLQPLHQARLAERAAGEWLARHAANRGCVLDSRGSTALYSGRPTFRHEAGALALASNQLAYVVVGSDELRSASPRARTLTQLLRDSGHLVASFRAADAAVDHAVLVYRWDADRFASRYGTSVPPASTQ
jgi:hypothetical protein